MLRLRRRKKGQGAIEYLFMIAAALVIILIAVRYVSNSGQQASSQGDLAMFQSQAELVKSNLVAQYGSNELNKLKVNYTEASITNGNFTQLYDLCMTNKKPSDTGLQNIDQITACKAIVNGNIGK
ncbi:class III signal peptide-containing protein [Thermococcus sp. 21S7]|uniref:class III signal peptide-containing protein n=1 Tax=Thermococcus sp. 21S7 TaxID=1638221 RepID=UPI00143B69AB|nr:class III signal peptide-containing protein [Thermococcus sp. 21S7]NJE60967.1 class III signal peptide-containing protein [Thermococcus sp. 21S7]